MKRLNISEVANGWQACVRGETKCGNEGGRVSHKATFVFNSIEQLKAALPKLLSDNPFEERKETK